jgi:hypothetical protein
MIVALAGSETAGADAFDGGAKNRVAPHEQTAGLLVVSGLHVTHALHAIRKPTL